MASLPTLKLLYFDFGGRAEVLRKMLRLGGVPFEDKRLSRAEFAELKPSLPYGQVPVLEVGPGQFIAETQAIIRYIAQLCGMYPKGDAMAALMVDEVLTALDDLLESLILPSFGERDAAKKKLMREAMLTGPLPTGLTQIETRLQRMAGRLLFQTPTALYAHEVVISDLVAVFQSGVLDHIPTDLIRSYPLMTAIHAKVSAIAPPVHNPSCAESNAPPAKLKLTYFDMAARAEPIRLALHVGGFSFTDERLSRAEFAKLKPSLPFLQVPVLEVDGQVMAQEFALLRFVGRLGGLYFPEDALLAAKIDEVIARVEDLYNKALRVLRETDEDMRAAKRETFVTELLPLAVAALDKRLAQWETKGSPFAVGGALTIADLALHQSIEMLRSGRLDFVPTTIVDAHANLLRVDDAVVKHPRVQDWYATRNTNAASAS